MERAWGGADIQGQRGKVKGGHPHGTSHCSVALSCSVPSPCHPQTQQGPFQEKA